MPAPFALKPTHAPVRAYYTALAQLANIGAKHETAVREAFHTLIEHCAGPLKWTLVREYAITRRYKPDLRLDGALVDAYRLVHGVVEAKDDDDDLETEIRVKIRSGYPTKNTLFWQPHRTMLMQDGKVVLDLSLYGENYTPYPENLIRVLELFFSYAEPAIADWERATDEFRERVAELGKSVRDLIQLARGTKGTVPNKKFAAAFANFAALCRAAINPSLADSAIEEMLIQHLLTVRLFTSIFNNPDFTNRNIIAAEIEKVIEALASDHFSRTDFLRKLDPFYLAIEHAAKTLDDFSEKQKFLNTVYEKFFQGFAVKVADTMGIVYTPPSIVRFMIASIRELLKKEFKKELASPGVHFLDPFTGTGNFLVHLMKELPTPALQQKYFGELWANEIMLLPYYIATLNMEREYYEATGKYEPFPGLCLVDTFELAEPRDQTEMEFLSAKNTERVNAQKKAPIRVILGNPPYNANQQDENDNNKNRKYPRLDQRIRNTYAADSKATLLNKLSDPYIKALAWASDRIGDEGIVALVTNSGYIEAFNADGVRAHLARDFDAIYVVDLGGNVRKNPKLSGTTHNVFGIQVGVSIALFIRHKPKELKVRKAVIRYTAVGKDWRKERKWQWLEDRKSVAGVKWTTLTPDTKHTWLREGLDDKFDTHLALGNKETKALDSLDAQAIFRTYSLGVSTNRDAVVYDFDRDRLLKRVEQFCDDYNTEVGRWKIKGRPGDIDNFVKAEHIKWSRNLKRELKNEKIIEFDVSRLRLTDYRPFTKQWLYFADQAIDELGQFITFQPKPEIRNPMLMVPTTGARSNFWCFIDEGVVNLNFMSLDAAQCFPLHTYAEDGTHRRDNVTDWALEQFKARYPGVKLTKRDIFHYVYAVLHHPAYREKFAANLRRELPRIPFAPDFTAFAKAGEKLAALHTGYESQKEFKLRHVETPGVKPDWRVERMRLSKDKTALIYNGWLTLDGIPSAAHDYRLGNRSALDWIIDQYRVERAKDNPDEILSDPNRADDEEHIVRLIGQVVTVSVETMKLVAGLPAWADAEPAKPAASPEPDSYTQAELDAAHVYSAHEEPPATE